MSLGVLVCVSEVTDYEVRRELLRAATLWALARNTGQTTAPPEALDADVILCSAVKLFTTVQGISLSSAIVATSNVAHIGRFVSADLWSNITP